MKPLTPAQAAATLALIDAADVPDRATNDDAALAFLLATGIMGDTLTDAELWAEGDAS